MSPSINPQTIHRIVQLSADLCEDSRARCAYQLTHLYNQRQELVVQRLKRAERHVAEMAELSALCESMGLESIAASLKQLKVGDAIVAGL